MKNLSIMLLVALCACGQPLEKYRPKVSGGPANYDADITECRKAAKQRLDAALYSDTCRLYGMFGLLGSAVNDANNPDNECKKDTLTMTDECMTAKGYKLVK